MPRRSIKKWPSYVLSVAFLVPLSLAGYVYYQLQQPAELSAEDELTATLIESIFNPSDSTASKVVVEQSWSALYPNTVEMEIAEVSVYASVADSWPERIKGLSDTPYLPDEVVKLFVFESASLHSIWMKDMQYAIDILWLDEAGTIVSIKESATPESFPETFVPTEPALYVVETVAGFVAKHSIGVGDIVVLPERIR